jgi:hypothetical protein
MSDVMSFVSSSVSPLLCVFWLPGLEDILSAFHEALYKKTISKVPSDCVERTSTAMASKHLDG